jgi:hypothetical protein
MLAAFCHRYSSLTTMGCRRWCPQCRSGPKPDENGRIAGFSNGFGEIRGEIRLELLPSCRLRPREKFQDR